MSVRAEHGDCLEVIPRLGAEGVICDAVVTDPPYHLTPMHKRFGQAFSAPPGNGRDGSFRRLSSGFMGQKWDGGDIAFRSETWATVATILRPGAFLVAFGGTRTFHRLVCAIEDAGFIVQDQIAWLFGSGFPKRRDMLKPAFEPICLAYKPGGARTMQIDECRISANGEHITAGHADSIRRGNFSQHEGWDRPHHHLESEALRREAAIDAANTLGRWPANVCHDGSDEVLEAFPETETGDESLIRSNGYSGLQDGKAFARAPNEKSYRPANSGSAARFFYEAKADAQDRWGSRHPTVKPVDLIRWLVKLVCPPGGLLIDPFAGSGTTGIAALAEGRRAILIECEDNWFADIEARLAWWRGEGQHSVVVKNSRRAAEQGSLL